MFTYSLADRQDEPIYVYLYKLIRSDIAENRIKPGSKLPSKRTLAEHLGVSVITVESAYRLLADEGYIVSKERSGYFVCSPDNMMLPAVRKIQQHQDDGENPEIDADFPFSTYSKIMRQVLSHYGETLLTKSPHNGCANLRHAISDFLARYRGMSVSPEQIVIGSGAEYLYGMIVQLLGRDTVYGLEDPSYEKIRLVYEANGAVCEMLPLDRWGIATGSLQKTNAQVIHVTPYRSYPTGITAPAAKRFEYLAWAKDNDGIIIEDDFSSEFAVNAKPVETIFSMDRTGRVIYVNTFSKSLTPSMRMGYMILPERLAAEYEKKLGFYSCTVPVIDQYVLAEFIANGSFERHLNRMRRKITTTG